MGIIYGNYQTKEPKKIYNFVRKASESYWNFDVSNMGY